VSLSSALAKLVAEHKANEAHKVRTKTNNFGTVERFIVIFYFHCDLMGGIAVSTCFWYDHFVR
jgi:hypothetical protein